MDIQLGILTLVVLNVVLTVILTMILDARLQKMETRWRNKYLLAEIK